MSATSPGALRQTARRLAAWVEVATTKRPLCRRIWPTRWHAGVDTGRCVPLWPLTHAELIERLREVADGDFPCHPPSATTIADRCGRLGQAFVDSLGSHG